MIPACCVRMRCLGNRRASVGRDRSTCPFRAGHRVHYRPPAWDTHARPGHIDIPEDISILLLEGVGAAQRGLIHLIDVAIWVQSDFHIAERLGIARDIASGVNGDETESTAFWHAWMAAEIPFLEQDRPWERVDAIVAGASGELNIRNSLKSRHLLLPGNPRGCNAYRLPQ
jgi:hypothetical protein